MEVIVAGVMFFLVILVAFRMLTATPCYLCGHKLFQHKKLRVEGRVYHECRVNDCDCDFIEDTPDFLRDCYGFEEHERGQ